MCAWVRGRSIYTIEVRGLLWVFINPPPEEVEDGKEATAIEDLFNLATEKTFPSIQPASMPQTSRLSVPAKPHKQTPFIQSSSPTSAGTNWHSHRNHSQTHRNCSRCSTVHSHISHSRSVRRFLPSVRFWPGRWAWGEGSGWWRSRRSPVGSRRRGRSRGIGLGAGWGV